MLGKLYKRFTLNITIENESMYRDRNFIGIGNIYCNNCGKKGHGYYNCNLPITSNGIIAYRFTPNNEIEYLMVCRKHSFGLIDFIRGKYAVNNKYYITNMFNQMTHSEKMMLKTQSFDRIWQTIWNKPADFRSSKSEESISCDKFNTLKKGLTITSANGQTDTYSLDSIIESVKPNWLEPEWGFPKGKRNYNESDLDCASREFCEETGLPLDKQCIVMNIAPYEEKFCGSNYKTYKNRYLLAKFDYTPAKSYIPDIESNEISDIQWKTFKECISCMRPYNLEKKRMLSSIDILLKTLI